MPEMQEIGDNESVSSVDEEIENESKNETPASSRKEEEVR